MAPPTVAAREVDLLWERIDKIENQLDKLSANLTRCFWASVVATAAIGGPPLVDQVIKAFAT